MIKRPLKLKRPAFTLNLFATIVIFTLFAIGLFLIHDRIWLYHDDFGYATLSYATSIEGIKGQNFTQAELLTFLRNEYMIWTGRVLPFFIEANSFKIGLPFTRLIQCCIIIAATWMATKLTSRSEYFAIIAVAVILYILSIPVFIAAGGVFWFSASISYLWGLPFLFYGAYRLQQDGHFTWQAIAAFALAALFQEQVAIACLTIAGLFAIQCLWAEKTIKKLFTLGLTTAPILLASSFILFSPGNFNRKALSSDPADSMTDLMEMNFETISDTLLSPTGNPLWANDAAVWLILLGLSFAILLFTTVSQRPKIITWALSGLALLISLSLAVEWPEYNVLICLIIGYGICLFNAQKRRNENYLVSYIYVAAVMTLFLILLTPAIAGRQYIPFFFLMIVPSAYSFALVLQSDHRWTAAIAILALTPVSIEQSVDIYDKYLENDIYMHGNDAMLRHTSRELNAGNTIDRITLTKLADSRFAETMPYQRPKIETWMRRYYALPEDLIIEWQAPPKKKTSPESHK